MREEHIEDEEHRMGLGPLEDGEVQEEQHLSFSSNTSNASTTSNTLEYRVDHQKRIIELMNEREKWFQSRIEQLEAFGKRISLELSELKKKYPEPPQPILPISVFTPPPLKLGNLSIPFHERIAQNMHSSILEEDDLIQGMTPTVPLIRIPTHSLKKKISWTDIENAGCNAFVCGGCNAAFVCGGCNAASTSFASSASASTTTNTTTNESNMFTIPSLSNYSLQGHEGQEQDQEDNKGQEPWCMWCPVTSGCDGDHGDEMRDGFLLIKSSKQ